jgi:lipopolysaccharide biosynthesis glycosyltransferase
MPHVAAMLHSLMTHSAPLDVRVHYMHGGDISARDQNLLRGMLQALGAEIDYIEVPDERVEGLPTKDFTRKATWYRIFLPELLPDVDRVLYLDADLIVTDAIEPLWRTHLAGAYAAAVTNPFPPPLDYRPGEIGLERSEYFNAGVLVLNLEAMRADSLSSALLRYGVDNAATLMMRDQDTLNAVMASRRLHLHPRWNCMNSILRFDWADGLFPPEQIIEARRNPAVRHFEGPNDNKPWHLLASAEARDLYMRHRRQTPWRRVRRDGVTPRNIARRFKRAIGKRRTD